MRPVVIFYHTVLNLHPVPDRQIVHEQAGELRRGGLMAASELFYVGVNGEKSEAGWLSEVIPEAEVFTNDPSEWSGGEVPTIRMLREWALTFPGWNVCYLHTKGASTPPSSLAFARNTDWRRNAMRHCITDWGQRVSELERGRNTTGFDLRKAFNGTYYGGNFWWARSEYLASLPEIITEGQIEGGRYEAELWIGKGKNFP